MRAVMSVLMHRASICCNVVLAFLGAWLVPATAFASQPIQAGDRLFMTKVYPGHGRLSTQDFQQIADAGFDVAVNVWVEDLPAYAGGAADVGLKVMTWNLGTVTASGADQTLNPLGLPTNFTRPTSDYAWNQIQQTLVDYATFSLTQPAMSGAILDFEIYGENGGYGFSESYDNYSFNQFMTAKYGFAPSIPASQRRSLLSTLGQLDAYIADQYQQVANRVAGIRQAIDAINPDFTIGVYGWGNLIGAVRQASTSTRAPVLFLDARTYARGPWPYSDHANTPDRQALKESLIIDHQYRNLESQADYPMIYMAGHYPHAEGPADGSQYRFTVRQAFNSEAYAADGYWIWTDWWLPPPWEDKQAWIDAMMDYFAQANAALDAGDFTWANRQVDSITDPAATDPLVILTTDGKSVTAWHPISGVAGRVEVDQSVLDQLSWLGFVVGDVDTLAGNELMRLTADGWVKIYDPSSNAQLLRFFVGTDQKALALVRAEFVPIPEPGVVTVLLACGGAWLLRRASRGCRHGTSVMI